MPGVAADGLPEVFERLDLGVDGEHLFHEGAPEMQQPHLERAFVFGAEGDPILREELRNIGLDQNASVGSLPLAVPASTNTRLRISPAPAKSWGYSKRSLRPKPPMVWLSLVTNVRRGMLPDRVAELLELAVDAVLTQRRVERARVEEWPARSPDAQIASWSLRSFACHRRAWRQRRKYAEIKAGERIQGCRREARVLVLTDLLADGSEHGPDARRLGGCGF